MFRAHHSINKCHSGKQHSGCLSAIVISPVRREKKCAFDAEMKRVEYKIARQEASGRGKKLLLGVIGTFFLLHTIIRIIMLFFEISTFEVSQFV